MKMRILCLNEVLKLAMEALGKHIAKRPYIFIFFSCITSIILGMGFVVSVYEAISTEYITISGGKYEENRKIMSSLFPIKNSKEFNPARLTKLPTGPIIFIIHRNGSSMIDHSVFRDIDRLDKIVRNVSIRTEKGLMNYASLCAIEKGSCFVNPLIQIIPKVDEILAGKYRFKYPVTIDVRRFEAVPFVLNLGGVMEDEEGYVKNFMAVRLFYYGDSTDLSKMPYIRQWESVMVKELGKFQFETIQVYVAAFSEVASDIQQVNEKLFPMSAVMAVAVVIFSMLAFTTNSWIKSKPWLGCAAGASAGLAVISSYGTMFYAGIHNNDLVMLVAFVVLGTEIDDAFVMVASWRSTNPKDSVEQRMAKTYSEAAVSVTVSSLTSFIAYCVGITAPIAVVHSVCLQCAVCILFTYLYQLLFFGSFMALDGYREKSERNAFLFCKTSSDKSKCDKGNDTGGAQEGEEILMKYMRDIYGGLLQFPVCKAVCLTLFAANLIIASLSVVGLRKGSDVYDILSTGSDTERAVYTQLRYFPTFQHAINIVVNKTLNYWERNVQESIENMLKTFEDHPNIADSTLTISWLKYYKIFTEHPLAKASFLSYDISKRENFMHGLRRAFLRMKPARQFNDDINFNENYTEITSTRYIVFCTNLSTIDDDIRLMNDIDAIAKKSEIPIIIFSTLFIPAEQGSVIGKIAVQTIWITSLLMFAVFLIFIANFPHAILVAVCVTSSMVGTLGFMSEWGLKLDIISLIVVVMCLGFSINYSAHMSYAFTTSQADTPHEKMKESIYRVGLPILQGSVSTIIAVSILIFQDIYIYTACFKVIFLTVIETFFHALVVLPVILSIFDSCVRSNPTEEKKNETNLPSFRVIESYHL